jgi:hypothetical protein
MNEATLRLFIEERLRAYDSKINLDTGAPATIEVVDPIVRRFLPDPLEPDLKKFALTRLRQEFPRLMAEEGAAIADLLIKPGQVLLEPLRREVRSVKRQLSLGNPSTLTSDEADALMYNVFVRRKVGDFARIKVRAYFTNPLSVQIGSTNFAFTGRNLRFIPTEPQTLTAEGMLLNSDGNLFYFDINYIAEAPGIRYNIAASEIAGITGLQAATRATNLARAEYGINEETTIQMIVRGEQSIGERSLTTIPGTVAILFEEFSDLQILQVIGFNDPEMQRDVITGGDRGEILYYGEDGESGDDGSAGAYTGWFDSASGNFTSRLGSVGTDISGYELTIFLGSAPMLPVEFTLGEVLGTTRVSINSSYEGSDRLPFPTAPNQVWVIRKKGTLTLSGIPGGVLFPNELATEVVIPDDEVHVGGCADVMVKGSTLEDKSLAVAIIADQQVIARRENAVFALGSRTVLLTDITSAEFDLIVPQRSTLYVETGPNEGPYKILEKTVPNLVYIQIADPSTLTTTPYPGHSYTVVDDIDIDLTGPKEIKYEGTDLQTYAGLKLVDTVSGLPDFLPVSGVGVTDEDIVEIIDGDDRGQYGIETGGVSASQLILEAPMTQTDGPLQYRIYRLGTGLELPLLRLKTVEMLDSDLKPRGAYIPYRNPVDVQSNSFQNPGRGAKAGTSIDPNDKLSRHTVTSQVVSSDVSNFYDLGVRIGDLLNVDTGDNRGFYTIVEVGGRPGGPLSANGDRLQLNVELMWPDSNMTYDVGSPSYGSFRLYFLDPVTFEASYEDTFFSIRLGNSSSIRFRPDPGVNDEFLPTSTTVPTVEMVLGDDNVYMWPPGAGVGTEIQYRVHDVKAADAVRITYAPLVGALDLASVSIDLDGKTFIVNVGSGYETVTFLGTTMDLTTIVSQINSQLSKEVASKYTRTVAPTGEYLMLRADHEIVVDGSGTATADILDDPALGGNSRGLFMPWYPVGDFGNNITDNDSPEEGNYVVDVPDALTVHGLLLNNLDGSGFSAQYTVEPELGHFVHISHVSIQRISSTEMADQQDDLSFYYFDVECISEGYGDTYNLGEDQQATVVGHYSEGWGVTVEDENLSYSMAEVPWLSISPRILVEGVDDDPNNYTELVGTSVQVNYERMPLIGHVHSYVMEKRNRVVCESPLARALFPTYIRTYINYRGGGSKDDVRADLVGLIEQTIPERDLETSDMHHVVRRLGSSYVRQPITVVGIGHQNDRSIWVTRSEDAIRAGRLSAMIPDDDGTTVEGSSYLILDRDIG